MSFRLFIWYCTLAGAASALAGWLLGRAFVHGEGLYIQGLKGVCLGLALAVGLALVDSLWNFFRTQLFPIASRVGMAAVVGILAGGLGGLMGEAFFQLLGREVFRVLGFTLVGLLIGLAV